MANYVIITRLQPETSRDLAQAAAAVAARIKAECPGVKWKDSYATLGQFDVIDIVEADDPSEVSKATNVIRDLAHGTTETLAAIPWKSFVQSLSGRRRAGGRRR